MKVVGNEKNKRRVKLQSRLSVITRERLNKISKVLGVTGTQAISDLIDKEYQKFKEKED